MSKSRQAALSIDNSLGFKNKIINGDMRIDQRNNGAVLTVGNGTVAGNYGPYSVDKWVIQSNTTNAGTGCGLTAQQVNLGSTRVVGSKGIQVIVTTAKAVTEPTCAIRAYYGIEGVLMSDAGFGTSLAKYLTISFDFKSSIAGQYTVSITNTANTRCYTIPFTITTANVLQSFSFVIPPETTGAWSTDNTAWGFLCFDFGSGSTYQHASVNAWDTIASNIWANSGTVFLAATLNATVTFGAVQLEVSPVATSFERLDYARQLIQCQRYYEYYGGHATEGGGNVVSGNPYYANYFWRVEKRTAPTIVNAVSNANNFFAATPGTFFANTTGAYESRTCTGSAPASNFSSNFGVNADF
jgi:hypothetical protein